VSGRKSLLMLAGFCGWAVLLDAPARLESTVPQDVRERESSAGGCSWDTSSRAQLLTCGVLASRSVIGTVDQARPRIPPMERVSLDHCSLTSVRPIMNSVYRSHRSERAMVINADVEELGERGLYVLKSRGTAHSNQIREFLLSDSGIEVVPVVIGAGGLLTGSARIAADSAELHTAQGLSLESAKLGRALERRKETVDAHVATLLADFESEELLIQRLIKASELRRKR
jgi:hypothetical protein